MAKMKFRLSRSSGLRRDIVFFKLAMTAILNSTMEINIFTIYQPLLSTKLVAQNFVSVWRKWHWEDFPRIDSWNLCTAVANKVDKVYHGRPNVWKPFFLEKHFVCYKAFIGNQLRNLRNDWAFLNRLNTSYREGWLTFS